MRLYRSILIVINVNLILIKCNLTFQVFLNLESHFRGANEPHMALELQVANLCSCRRWLC